MCAGCVTSLDAYVWGATGLASAVLAAGERARDRARGRSARQRRNHHFDVTAELLEAMGHDPAAVLGPRPEPAMSGDGAVRAAQGTGHAGARGQR